MDSPALLGCGFRRTPEAFRIDSGHDSNQLRSIDSQRNDRCYLEPERKQGRRTCGVAARAIWESGGTFGIFGMNLSMQLDVDQAGNRLMTAVRRHRSSHDGAVQKKCQRRSGR